MKLSSIYINPANPRLIKDDRFKKLCQSIQEFPKMMALRPIIIDNDGMILGGNMRYKALKELGYKEVPDEWVKRDGELTDEEKQRFIIADNVPFGEYDWDILANEWDKEQLIEWGVEIPDFAFKQEAVEDDYDIPDEIKTDIVLGDLFEIGQHRLLCGDSTKAEDVARLMDGQKADMVFTDPPYGVSIGKKNKFLNSFQPSGRNLSNIKDDSQKPEDLYGILLLAFKNLKAVLNDCCTVFVTAPQGGGLGMMMMMMMRDAGLEAKHVLMWYKNSPTFSMGRLDYEYQHEPILLTWNKSHKFYGGGQFKTSVWKIDKPRSNKEHPTMKPIALIENAMLNNSKQDDIVVDIYGGSGSTMVAGHQLNRKVFMQEIDPKYCAVILRRMKKLDPEIVIKKNGKAYY